MAYLAQKPVTILGSGAELTATQHTVISSATILVTMETVLTAESTVEDIDGVVNGNAGAVFQVEGQPADRHSQVGRSFRAASLRLISDLQ